MYKIIRFSVEITCSWIKWSLLCKKYNGWEKTSPGLSRVPQWTNAVRQK